MGHGIDGDTSPIEAGLMFAGKSQVVLLGMMH